MLATKYGSRPFKVLQRTSEIVLGLGSFAFKLWLDKQNGKLDQNISMRAIELRKFFTALGPTVVKIGQGLSTRPDICPLTYLEELSQLQKDLPTFPNAESFTCIERELGSPLEAIYSSISPSPIAAAMCSVGLYDCRYLVSLCWLLYVFVYAFASGCCMTYIAYGF